MTATLDLPDMLRPPDVRPIPLDQLMVGLAPVPESLCGIPIADVAYDSRRVRPDCLYVGLNGAHAHGAAYAAQAMARGAVAMMTDQQGADIASGAGLPVLVVDEPRRLMAHVVARLFGAPTDQRLSFGVTGTAGKTTICWLLCAALQAHGLHVGYVGSIGFTFDGQQMPVHRTTPTTPESVDLQAALALMAEDGADCFAMEASSGGLALDRLEAVDFDIVGFSNLGHDHLDFHHTMENYFQAKAKLFSPGWARKAVINIDDAAGRRLAGMIAEAGAPALITIGKDPAADYQLIGRDVVDGQQHVRYRQGDSITSFALDLPGEYNAQNAMIAIAMMHEAGFDQDETLAAIGKATVPGRMQRVDLGEGAPVAFIDFGHTPEATETALQAVPRPSIVVLGAGGDRDHSKRALMGAAAARQADIVIITDDNARTEDPKAIRQEVMAGALAQAAVMDREVQVIDGGDRVSAIKQAFTMVAPGWSVAVLGRGNEEFMEVRGGLIPFRDETVMLDTWQELMRGRS